MTDKHGRELKVRDTVKVTGNNNNFHHFPLGTVGVVTGFGKSSADVLSEGFSQFVYPTDLEKITRGRPKGRKNKEKKPLCHFECYDMGKKNPYLHNKMKNKILAASTGEKGTINNQPKHLHKWTMVSTGKEYVNIGSGSTGYKTTEYAYLLCQCMTVKKVEIEKL